MNTVIPGCKTMTLLFLISVCFAYTLATDQPDDELVAGRIVYTYYRQKPGYAHPSGWYLTRLTEILPPDTASGKRYVVQSSGSSKRYLTRDQVRAFTPSLHKAQFEEEPPSPKSPNKPGSSPSTKASAAASTYDGSHSTYHADQASPSPRPGRKRRAVDYTVRDGEDAFSPAKSSSERPVRGARLAAAEARKRHKRQERLQTLEIDNDNVFNTLNYRPRDRSDGTGAGARADSAGTDQYDSEDDSSSPGEDDSNLEEDDAATKRVRPLSAASLQAKRQKRSYGQSGVRHIMKSHTKWRVEYYLLGVRFHLGSYALDLLDRAKEVLRVAEEVIDDDFRAAVKAIPREHRNPNKHQSKQATILNKQLLAAVQNQMGMDAVEYSPEFSKAETTLKRRLTKATKTKSKYRYVYPKEDGYVVAIALKKFQYPCGKFKDEDDAGAVAKIAKSLREELKVQSGERPTKAVFRAELIRRVAAAEINEARRDRILVELKSGATRFSKGIARLGEPGTPGAKGKAIIQDKSGIFYTNHQIHVTGPPGVPTTSKSRTSGGSGGQILNLRFSSYDRDQVARSIEITHKLLPEARTRFEQTLKRYAHLDGCAATAREEVQAWHRAELRNSLGSPVRKTPRPDPDGAGASGAPAQPQASRGRPASSERDAAQGLSEAQLARGAVVPPGNASHMYTAVMKGSGVVFFWESCQQPTNGFDTVATHQQALDRARRALTSTRRVLGSEEFRTVLVREAKSARDAMRSKESVIAILRAWVKERVDTAVALAEAEPVTRPPVTTVSQPPAPIASRSPALATNQAPAPTPVRFSYGGCDTSSEDDVEIIEPPSKQMRNTSSEDDVEIIEPPSKQMRTTNSS